MSKKVLDRDLLSPTISILCIEYLAIMLRQKTRYCDLKTGTALLKLSLFTDDTVIFLNDSTTEFKQVFTILEAFGSKSGCKVKLRKSCVFHWGSKQKTIAKSYYDKGLL